MKPKTIEQYIIAAPATVQERLLKLHDCICAAAPDAIQELKWNMPAYSYQKILVTFAVFKNILGFIQCLLLWRRLQKSWLHIKPAQVLFNFHMISHYRLLW